MFDVNCEQLQASSGPTDFPTPDISVLLPESQGERATRRTALKKGSYSPFTPIPQLASNEMYSPPFARGAMKSGLCSQVATNIYVVALRKEFS